MSSLYVRGDLDLKFYCLLNLSMNSDWLLEWN